ncbi:MULTISPECIES: twin-arginine translocase subunit TatC [unclassified Streptomyces]|uniref:twin-arginine translocase subunit TatC n=1 Tax=unclassified Streptomyces TaxID=2593676 RepID=UPI00386682E4
MSPFGLASKVASTAGVVGASPGWLHQLWAFLAPGLLRRENWSRGVTNAAHHCEAVRAEGVPRSSCRPGSPRPAADGAARHVSPPPSVLRDPLNWLDR